MQRLWSVTKSPCPFVTAICPWRRFAFCLNVTEVAGTGMESSRATKRFFVLIAVNRRVKLLLHCKSNKRGSSSYRSVHDTVCGMIIKGQITIYSSGMTVIAALIQFPKK
jgi:hypothetical protein